MESGWKYQLKRNLSPLTLLKPFGKYSPRESENKMKNPFYNYGHNLWIFIIATYRICAFMNMQNHVLLCSMEGPGMNVSFRHLVKIIYLFSAIKPLTTSEGRKPSLMLLPLILLLACIPLLLLEEKSLPMFVNTFH